ncbi:MAG: outer membrane beta-barrel protein [Alphaproteobacteria bacterium]|nr:outer membrane beta-barrel protein [Alphaproteobacteria bacterium]
MKLKGFLTSAAAMAIIASTSSANAADIAKHKPHHVKQMAIAAVAPTAPVFNWAGPYIGLDVGASTNKFNFYGRHFGMFTTSFKKSLAGIYAGYNFPIHQHIIFGIEGNINLLSPELSRTHLKSPSGSDTPDGYAYELYQEKMGAAAARMRLGYAQGRFMPYIAGGGSITRSRAVFGDAKNGITAGNTEFYTYYGWNIGAGIDFAAARNVVFRAEYNIRKTFNNKFYFVTPPTPSVLNTDQGKFTTRQVRIGAAYKF